MKRTTLKERVLPNYSKPVELFNSISHIVGSVFGVAALTICVAFAAVHQNVYAIISSAIYGASMIVLYTISGIYHGLNGETIKKVFQVLDHDSVYLLIGGSYTPIIFCKIIPFSTAIGWTMFGIVWGLTILGIVFKSIDFVKFRIITMVFYLLIGWSILFVFPFMIYKMGFARFFNYMGATPGFILLLGGGVAYTIGSVFLKIGQKKDVGHSILHIFVLLGSFLHFFYILLYVI